MGHKIFVSYKYFDYDVRKISNIYSQADTVRTYVDKLAEYIDNISEHIYKGEGNGEDLSKLSNDTIWEKLKDRIFDSTLTIVMISKGMKVPNCKDRNQWIPWEISYSLKEESRKNKSGQTKQSYSNAILAIVVPDKNGSYDYYTGVRTCCSDTCRYFNTYILFEILRNNMFNLKNAKTKICEDNTKTYYGDSSYISTVCWDDFIIDPEKYINKAYDIQSNIVQYDIQKEVEV